MNNERLAAWQTISAHRLLKAAIVVKRNTTQFDGRRPSSIEWGEWSAAMVQAMSFGIDTMLVIERAK